jgi:hypothetical protein
MIFVVIFEVLTAVRMMMLFLCVLAPCRLVSPKRCHLPTSLHGAKTQKNSIMIFVVQQVIKTLTYFCKLTFEAHCRQTHVISVFINFTSLILN